MEYKSRLDRLQMSLFSTLYHKAGGYLIVPSVVFKNLKNTEWGKLKNFNKAIKVIEKIYYREANETLDWSNDISTFRYCGDSIRADQRFDTQEARPNDRMIQSYNIFILEVGKKLGFEFKRNFRYFEKGKKNE